jgi:hypothetical protein
MTLKKAYLLILAAFVWLILGATVFNVVNPRADSVLGNVMGWGLLAGFSILFLAGTAVWAGAKGYHPVLGIVLGWLGPLGLLVLVFLSDQSPQPNRPPAE